MIVLNLPSAPSPKSCGETTCPCGVLSIGPWEALGTVLYQKPDTGSEWERLPLTKLTIKVTFTSGCLFSFATVLQASRVTALCARVGLNLLFAGRNLNSRN